MPKAFAKTCKLKAVKEPAGCEARQKSAVVDFDTVAFLLHFAKGKIE